MADDEFSVDDLREVAELHDPSRTTVEDLDEAQNLDASHIKNADSISAELTRRLGDVGSLHRAIDRKKPAIQARLETKQELAEDEDLYDSYLMGDPEAKRYVTTLEELIGLYQDLVDNFLPANITLHKTADQLADVVDEQQLRHDESFVLEHTRELTKDIKASFEDTAQSLRQSHESTNEALVDRFDRMLDRHGQVSEHQAVMQELMTEMATVLQEFAAATDTSRSKRIEDKLDKLTEELEGDSTEE